MYGQAYAHGFNHGVTATLLAIGAMGDADRCVRCGELTDDSVRAANVDFPLCGDCQ